MSRKAMVCVELLDARSVPQVLDRLGHWELKLDGVNGSARMTRPRSGPLSHWFDEGTEMRTGAAYSNCAHGHE